MARIFITGSPDGLGRATAESILDDSHQVIVHARSASRLTAVQDLLDRGAEGVTGDLSDIKQTRLDGVDQGTHKMTYSDSKLHVTALAAAVARL